LDLPETGVDPGGGISPPKTYETNFIHHGITIRKNRFRDIRPFCRLLFCHSSVVKYTSSLLQWRNRYETPQPNITEIAPPPKLTGWIRLSAETDAVFKLNVIQKELKV